MGVKLVYETATCSRCGGSGHYSYCSMYGTTCFKCRGRKRTLSRAGAKASAAVNGFIADNFTVPVESLVPGDRVTVDGRYTRTIATVERREHAFGSGNPVVWSDGITLTFTKSYPGFMGACDNLGMAVGSTMIKAVAGADWDRVVAFARTLKKGVTLVEPAAAAA